MDREMIDRIRRHQGQETLYKIGEDEFPFKPLGWEHIDKFFTLGSGYEDGKSIIFDEKNIGILKELVYEFVKNSWDKPEELTNEAWERDLKSFCATNITRLMEILFKIHNFEATETASAKSSIEKIKSTRERMDEIRAKSAENTVKV